MSLVDLHVHTTASDGSLSPSELTALSARRGLSVLAVADHDTLDGIHESEESCRREGISFIPALEISVDLTGGGSAHMLGYFPFTGTDELLDPESPLGAALDQVRQGRNQRNPEILSRLAELGLHVDPDEVKRISGSGVVGRPHIAEAMIRSGHVASHSEAFEKYLAKGKPAYVERMRLFALRALELIRGAGGIPVLAHPGLLRRTDRELEALISSLTDNGLRGLEVYYPSHSEHITSRLAAIAARNGLLITGGTDYHGRSDSDLMPGGSLSGFSIDSDQVEEFLMICFPEGVAGGKAQ